MSRFEHMKPAASATPAKLRFCIPAVQPGQVLFKTVQTLLSYRHKVTSVGLIS